MLVQRFIGQPGGGTVLGELAQHLASGEFHSMAAAVAYVTVSGTSSLLGSAPSADIELIDKRWLAGIDWYRSDPLALSTLDGLPNSALRVFDGQEVVSRKGCVPRVPYHPKAWIFDGDSARAIVTGSANLSRNGLARGHEADTVTIVSRPSTKAENEAWTMIDTALDWFQQQWDAGTALGAILTTYKSGHAAHQVAAPTPTEDDAVESSHVGVRAGAFTATDLIKLRTSSHFWLQAGNLTKNLGPGNPGNQVMLKAFTRVFFGFRAQDVPQNTLLGEVSIEIAGVTHHGRTLRYSDNSMDVLTLPAPGVDGAPAWYDQETLLFRRVMGPAGHVRYVLTVAGAGDAAQWRRRSRAVDGLWRMSSGREFGAF